jgi:hypothetical protein
LCGMEQARRPALAHHVHWTAPMGPRVLINGIWYKIPLVESMAFMSMISAPFRYNSLLISALAARISSVYFGNDV